MVFGSLSIVFAPFWTVFGPKFGAIFSKHLLAGVSGAPADFSLAFEFDLNCEAPSLNRIQKRRFGAVLHSSKRNEIKGDLDTFKKSLLIFDKKLKN